MTISTTPLWQEQAPAVTGTVDAVPQRVDVAIVGGGYTGLMAARELARLGVSAVVLERDDIGFGASSRNGGKALVGLKHEASTIVRQHGAERGKALWEAAREGITALETLVAEERIDCDFTRCGSVFLAAKAKHFEKMQRETDWLATHFGYQRTNVPRDELAGEIGTQRYFGGVVDAESAGLHPAKLVAGLAGAAIRAGAVLCPRTQVHCVEQAGGGVAVRTSRGNVSADQVLLATNGYTGPEFPFARRRVVPVGSYIIATEPLNPEVAARVSPRGRMFFDSKWYLSYFRLTPDRRMLFGGRTTISTEQDLSRSAAKLQQVMVAVFPELANVAVTHSWTGHLGLSFDALPHICREGACWSVLGYSGHGVVMSIHLGRQVGELMAGRRSESLFMDVPAPTKWFYRRRPWFRPILGAGLRLMDWIT